MTGDTLLILSPLAAEWPAANAGRIVVRNQHPVIALAVDEIVQWTAILPQHYAGGGLAVIAHVTRVTDESPTPRLAGLATAIERLTGGQDLDADGFAAEVETGMSISVTPGALHVASIAHDSGAEMDAAGAGDAFRLRVRRYLDAGWFNPLGGDLHIAAIEIREA